MSAQAIDIYEDSFSEDSFELNDSPLSTGRNTKHEEIEVIKTDPMEGGIRTLPLVEEQEAGKKEEVSSDEEEDDSESESTSSTVECLSRDPLFLVLSNFMSNDKGNITDALFKINRSLRKIITLLEEK